MTIERGTVPALLNGGYIDDLNLDLKDNVLSLRVEVLETGRQSVYILQFERFSSIEIDTVSHSRSDSRLQLTELSVDEGPEESDSEEWTVTISLWDQTHFQIRCSEIRVDEASVR